MSIKLAYDQSLSADEKKTKTILYLFNLLCILQLDALIGSIMLLVGVCVCVYIYISTWQEYINPVAVLKLA